MMIGGAAAETIVLQHMRDVSEWQGEIDWNYYAVNKHPELVACYMRAGRGPGIADKEFSRNVKASRVARMHLGAYWYLVPSVGSPQLQVDALVDRAQRVGGANLRPALDLEDDPEHVGRYRAWYVAAIARARRRLGYFPTVYGSTDYLESLALPEWASQCPLWLASYGTAHPSVPAPWTHWSAWQYTDKAHDPACKSEYVDESRVSDVRALLVPTRLQLVRGAGGRLPAGV